jgi:hypothetical protein
MPPLADLEKLPYLNAVLQEGKQREHPNQSHRHKRLPSLTHSPK